MDGLFRDWLGQDLIDAHLLSLHMEALVVDFVAV